MKSRAGMVRIMVKNTAEWQFAAAGKILALEKSYFFLKSVQSMAHFINSACWNKIVIAERCSEPA